MRQLKSGLLDVKRLEEAKIDIPASIKECPLVAIEFLCNPPNGKKQHEAVFIARDMSGNVVGNYYQSAFKELYS